MSLLRKYVFGFRRVWWQGAKVFGMLFLSLYAEDHGPSSYL